MKGCCEHGPNAGKPHQWLLESPRADCETVRGVCRCCGAERWLPAHDCRLRKGSSFGNPMKAKRGAEARKAGL